MRYANEQALSTAVRSGRAHPVYLLYGPENYLIENWARRLCAAAGDDPFNFQRLDGRKPDLDALWDAVEALPLMAAHKCVLLDDIDPAALSSGDWKQLEELLGDPPASCTLVVTAKAPGFEAKSAGGKKLLGLIDSAGAVAELGARAQSDLVRYLSGIASGNGCEIGPDECRYLLDLCERDMLALRGEMEKVCAFALGGGEARITRSHIDAVAVPRVEARVFDLQKCILSGDAARALHLLDALFYLREPPVAVLGVMSMGFCDLYRARAARDQGLTLPDFTARLGYKGREFRAKRAYADCVRHSAAQLRGMLGTLLDCDTRLKSSPVSERVLLEQTVVALIMAARERR